MGGSCRSAVIFTKTSWGDRFMYQSVGWPREWYLVEAIGFGSYIRDIVAKMLNPMGLLPPPSLEQVLTRQFCLIGEGSAARFDVYSLPKTICSKQKQDIKPFPHHDLSFSKCPKQKQAPSGNIKNYIVVKMICFDSALQSTNSTHPRNKLIILIRICPTDCTFVCLFIHRLFFTF